MNNIKMHSDLENLSAAHTIRNVLLPHHQYQISDDSESAKTVEHYFVTIMDTKYLNFLILKNKFQ
jgi:hypothetical protein